VKAVRLSAEVADALACNRPVVALESTIFSTLGLPEPLNAEALARCTAAVRGGGAVPALCAVLDGTPCVGLSPAEEERMLEGRHKVAERDLGPAVASRLSVGVTTVSATMALCASTGVDVFATGGMGGVHRGALQTGDVSADVAALTRHRVALVTAGAKAILDLPRTLELLETLSVPVVGLGTDDFPAFYSRSSGLPVPHRVPDAAGAAAVAAAAWRLGWPGSIVMANPVPAEHEIPAAELEPVIAAGVAEVSAAGITGPQVTPFLLRRVADVIGPRGPAANVALAEHNAAAAAAIATALRAAVILPREVARG
jgi:pseudouridylate synthase